MDIHFNRASVVAPYTTRARAASIESMLIGGQRVFPTYATTFEHVLVGQQISLTFKGVRGRQVLIETEASLRSNAADRTGYPGTLLMCRDIISVTGPNGFATTLSHNMRYPIYCATNEALSTTMMNCFNPPEDGEYTLTFVPIYAGQFWITAQTAPTAVTAGTGTPWADVTVTVWP